MAPTQPRQRDIARAARVAVSTVSRALRGDPQLPEATRKRIWSLAASMGYRPDPLLSALSSYRRKGEPGRHRPGIAYLRHALAPKEPYHADLLRGAQDFAARYGYTIDLISFGRAGSSGSLDRVLLARGIRGLLVEPCLPDDVSLGLDPGRYAIVVVDKPYFPGDFDRVCYDNFGGGQEIREQAQSRGYRRLGPVILSAADRAGEGKLRAGLLIELRGTGPGLHVNPLVLQRWDAARFTRWFQREQPDIVVTSQGLLPNVSAVLDALGLKAPDDLGLLNANIHELPSEVSGIHHDNRAIGAVAAEMLIGKLVRHEYGEARHSHLITQKGRWNEGRTLRPRA